nr:hypothetical protein [uncultured Draconibacterium sp.]
MTTVFDRFREIVEYYNLHKDELDDKFTEVIYRRKDNHSDTLQTLEEAVERGVNLANYETVDCTTTHREVLVEMFTGQKGKYVSDEAVEIMGQFVESVKKIAKDEFDTQLKSLNSKIFKSKDKDLIDKLRKERVQLYIDWEKTPRKSFSDLELYFEIKNKGNED